MLDRTTEHLVAMRSSLAAANYKLKFNPIVENTLIGDKNFASKFVVEAINELKHATKDIDKQIESLESVLKKKKSSNHELRVLLQISASIFAIIGIAIGYYLLKSK